MDTRTALLDAAERLFSRHGYAAIGIREIVDEAGVNLAAIKYHFGSKSGLYLETVRRVMERTESGSPWEELAATPTSPHDAGVMLARFIRAFLRRLLCTRDGSRAALLFLREATEPGEAIDTVINNFIGPHHTRLTEIVAVISPHLDEHDLGLHAQSVLAQILHYRTYQPFLERLDFGRLNDEVVLDRIAEHIGRFSLRGLGCASKEIDQILESAQSAHAQEGSRK